jgi:hypothetical protein
MSSTLSCLRPFTVACALGLLAGCAGDPVVPPPPPCSGECSTHDDGYQWAMRGTLSDPKQCDDKRYTPAFVLGCRDAVNDFSQMRPSSTGL